jgi:hypothetical protein
VDGLVWKGNDEKHSAEEGRKPPNPREKLLFFCLFSFASSREPPEYETDEGHKYYYNKLDASTTWERPPDPDSADLSAPAPAAVAPAAVAPAANANANASASRGSSEKRREKSGEKRKSGENNENLEKNN